MPFDWENVDNFINHALESLFKDIGTHKIRNEILFLLSYRKMMGLEYMLSEVMEPHLFVIRKQKRDSPEKVTPMLAYYILDGSIYQAPQLCNVFAARVVSFIILVYSFFFSCFISV